MPERGGAKVGRFEHLVSAAAAATFLACGLSGCTHAPALSGSRAVGETTTGANAMTAPSPSAAPARYDLSLAIDRKQHLLAVRGTLESPSPIRSFFLHPQLTITSLRAGSRDLPFHRRGERVVLDETSTHFAIEYSGQLSAPPLPLVTDGKSAAWLGETVRLTEITFWYPVLARTGSDESWPPAPATAKLTLPALSGLSWVTSGQKQADGTFLLDIPGELVVTAVPSGAVRESANTAENGAIAFDVHSPRAESIAARAKPILAALAAHLGGVATSEVAAIVEYPVASANWLSFASADLVLFDSVSVGSFLAGDSRATEIWAHELSHLWLGRALRPEGPLSRWLGESFAEYYAWRAIAKVRGAADAQIYISRAEDDAKDNPRRIDALAEDDNRLYTRGALAVRALASLAGEDRFDGLLRTMAQSHHPVHRGRALRGARGRRRRRGRARCVPQNVGRLTSR